MKINEIIKQGQFDKKIMNPSQPLFRKPGSINIPVWQTPQFKAWFRGSKIVDSIGKPLIVYHGTTSSTDFSVFNNDESVGLHTQNDPRSQIGIHFAKESHVAGKFAKGLYSYSDENGRIYPAYLRIVKPFPTKDSVMLDIMLSWKYNNWAVDAALETAPENTELSTVEEAYEFYDKDIEFRKHINDVALALGEDDTTFAADMGFQYRKWLIGRGYDGIIYKNEVEGGTSYIVFNPNQIKSALNIGTFNKNTTNISEISPYLSSRSKRL